MAMEQLCIQTSTGWVCYTNGTRHKRRGKGPIVISWELTDGTHGAYNVPGPLPANWQGKLNLLINEAEHNTPAGLQLDNWFAITRRFATRVRGRGRRKKR